MNTRLLRRIAKLIQVRPREFNMLNFEIQHNCHTTRCIGGWAEHFSGGTEGYKALGISEEEYYRLCYANAWPEKFKRKKPLAESNPASGNTTDPVWMVTPKQAVARIEHFIKTGGRE